MKTLLALILFITLTPAKAQYTINDVFGDLTECDTMTRGGFIVWWDQDFDMTTEAIMLLDSLMSYRDICLDELDMMDPPNPLDDYFYNIYATNGGDFFAPNGWGQGQGTDINGYPFLTLPNLWDVESVAHEVFHVFQYNATSPGFSYSGDSQWYIEATANWFAGRISEGAPRAFIEAESLVRLPHVPLWLSYDNMPDDYPSNWQRFVHQYAMALWLYYLTDEVGISPDIIAGGLYAGTEELPQEYFFNQIGGSEIRGYFMDWGAHMTNEFDFIIEEQRTANLNEWNWYAELEDDNEFTESYVNAGSDGWVRPSDDEITNAWAFNTFKVENNINQVYTFELMGDETGSYDDPAYFDGRIVVKGAGGTTFHNLTMTDDFDGKLTLDLSATDTAVFFIIGSIPEIFEDTNPSFQRFGYEMQITTGFSSVNEQQSFRKEMARYNVMGHRIDQNYQGVQIILFDDGSTQKVVNFQER
ncbi:MAG: hypothetical protein GQ574_05405 [Crocinitomix sp.]|nr:hypothetical protein [Crocinitomix sp.]